MVGGHPDGAAPGNRHFGSGMEYVAAMIAKLKDSVMKGSKSAKFAVFDFCKNGKARKEYTWLWDAPNEGEKEQMGMYLQIFGT